MQSETKLTAKYVKLLRKSHHALVLNICGGEYQDAGWPDCFIAHWKFRGFIEFKGPKTKLEDLQSYVLENLVKRKMNAYVCRFLEEKVITVSNYNESIRYYTINGRTYEEVAHRLLIVLEGLSDGPVKCEELPSSQDE